MLPNNNNNKNKNKLPDVILDDLLNLADPCLLRLLAEASPEVGDKISAVFGHSVTEIAVIPGAMDLFDLQQGQFFSSLEIGTPVNKRQQQKLNAISLNGRLEVGSWHQKNGLFPAPFDDHILDRLTFRVLLNSLRDHRITELSLTNCSLTTADFAVMLPHENQLRSLRLVNCVFTDNFGLDAIMKPLGACTSITVVDCNCKYPPDFAKILKDWKRLKPVIDFCFNRLPDFMFCDDLFDFFTNHCANIDRVMIMFDPLLQEVNQKFEARFETFKEEHKKAKMQERQAVHDLLVLRRARARADRLSQRISKNLQLVAASNSVSPFRQQLNLPSPKWPPSNFELPHAFLSFGSGNVPGSMHRQYSWNHRPFTGRYLPLRGQYFYSTNTYHGDSTKFIYDMKNVPNMSPISCPRKVMLVPDLTNWTEASLALFRVFSINCRARY